MAKLTQQQKLWLVQCLAEFHTPTEAANAFLDEFGVEIEPKQVERYDPNKYSGQQLAKDLKALFVQHREAYLKDTKKHIPIANKTVRLRMMAKSAREFERQGNHLGLLRVLEQVAKEMGGSYTNLRQFSGKDGKPIQFEDVTRMTDEQLDAELMQLGYNPDKDVHPAPATKQ